MVSTIRKDRTWHDASHTSKFDSLHAVMHRAILIQSPLTSTMRLTARTQMPRSAAPRTGTCFRNAGAPVQAVPTQPVRIRQRSTVKGPALRSCCKGLC